jgi:Cdc6-like AAA superfamily ATPase
MPDNIERIYGLKQPNFILDPVADAEFYAKRTKVDLPRIVEGLRVDLITQVAPKRLYYGPYGGGKTHTLTNTMLQLHHMTDGAIEYVRVECPDMPRKATFNDLYREGIMRQLGQSFVLTLLEDLLEHIGTVKPKELDEKLRTYLGDEDFVNAVSGLRRPKADKILFWAWLSGVPVSKGDLENLSQTQDLTAAEAARLADMIIAIARVVKELRKKTLILILDEMERLKGVGPETVITFRTAFTRLVDPSQKHLAVLIGASGKDLNELPDVFSSAAITSRLGDEAIVLIPHMVDPEVDQFIKDIIAHFRAAAPNINELLTKAKTQTTESMTPELFPFTTEALQKLKSKFKADITPRDILLNMTKALGRAILSNQAVIAVQSV